MYKSFIEFIKLVRANVGDDRYATFKARNIYFFSLVVISLVELYNSAEVDMMKMLPEDKR